MKITVEWSEEDMLYVARADYPRGLTAHGDTYPQAIRMLADNYETLRDFVVDREAKELEEKEAQEAEEKEKFGNTPAVAGTGI